MDGTADLELVDKNITDDKGNYAEASNTNSSSLDYRLNTAWKTGISLGHTIGSNLALGATYEYAWYNHMDNRVKDGGYYDGYWDEYYETSSSDDLMNDHTKQSLQGVSTLKLGLEYKPVSMLALRLGYNYVSPMFKEGADRDQTIPSQGTIYATSTDYTNWKATNRFTAGEVSTTRSCLLMWLTSTAVRMVTSIHLQPGRSLVRMQLLQQRLTTSAISC